MLTLHSKIREIYAHPLGRDIADKLLLELGKPAWVVDNPVVGSLTLSVIKKFLPKHTGSGFLDTVLDLLNSEPDSPDDHPAASSPAWWKEAVFYQIYPRSFRNNGASCVLRGILQKLDYLRALGVDAVWLSPVYDSPNDDNGYDIRDYYKILPEYGTMDDMDALIAGLHERGMRLVMDLVVNHTSDEHPWFQSALHDENSPYRDFYFFRKTDSKLSDSKPPNNWVSFFGGPAWNHYPEQDVWALHLFSKKQMDLNWECPALREEIYKMARWWLAKGVDGFRLDVINYISKTPGLPDGDPFIGSLLMYTGIERYFYGPKLNEYLKELRAKAFDPYNAFSVGETPGIGIRTGRLLTDSYRRELDLFFSFDHLVSPGCARFDGRRYSLPYLKRFYRTHLNADLGHGWNTLFFNNHDNPRMVSKIDPEGLYTVPLAKLLAVLQLTLRGTPFLYQGDEAGVCNIDFKSIDEINDVESRGFYAELIKTMPPDKAFKQILAGTREHARAPIDWEEHESQRGRADSVWRFYRDLIILRRSSQALIYGELEFLYPRDKKLLSYTRRSGTECFYIEANLSPVKRRSKAMPGAVLLFGNYGKSMDKGPGPRILGPYEARVYAVPPDKSAMDNQLGIVFTSGEGPEPQTLKALLDDLASSRMAKGTLVAAADSGLALAEAAGIKPDWIVGDMDSLDNGSRLSHYPKERVICYPVDKDYTDTEIALALLWEKGCKDTWIVGGGGGRLDHLFGIRDLFERERYPRRWITADEDIYCIDGTEVKNDCLRLTLMQDKLVSVLLLGGGPWKAESRGLKWPLDNVRWERGLYGLSNVAITDEIEVSAKQGRFMVILEEGCRRL
jgi:oligo-1,6-glucosidase